MTYYYKTEVGTFVILPQPNSPGRYWLKLNDEALGSYHSAASAADDVYMKATGYPRWDIFSSEQGPHDLFEWNKVAR